MHDNMWADYPFPLISTPAVEVGYADPYVKSSSKMAITHNVLIRGMNAMYLQCEYVTRENVTNFLTFCQCWSEMLHNHHECEEMAYFPIIEKAVGVEGLSESNLDEHEAFMPGLRKFDAYVYSATPETYSGTHLCEILDSFAAALQMHLTDEVVWILSLRQYPDLDLTAIDAQHGAYVKSHSSHLRLLPYLLTNHDRTYENGIHAWWPSGGRAIRWWFLKYICTLWHHSAWQFSSCTPSGKPRNLQGRVWEHLQSAKVEMAMVEMQPEIGPRLPEKALVMTRIDTSETTPSDSKRSSGSSHSHSHSPRTSTNYLVR